jgi:hypothetical protein
MNFYLEEEPFLMFIPICWSFHGIVFWLPDGAGRVVFQSGDIRGLWLLDALGFKGLLVARLVTVVG